MSASRKLRTRSSQLLLSLAATVLLASCGGGDPYAGLWLGWVAPERQATTVVLDDGKYYMLYKRPELPFFSGVIEGSVDFQGAKVTSRDGVDYNWLDRTGTRPAPLSAKIGGHMTATGTVNDTRPFSIAYDKNFGGDARPENVEGSFRGWAVFALGPREATFNVTGGVVTSVINDCQLKGAIVPRTDTNAYDLTLKFGGAPCHPLFVGAELKGVAVYRAESGLLEAAIVHGSRTQAMAFSGIKAKAP